MISYKSNCVAIAALFIGLGGCGSDTGPGDDVMAGGLKSAKDYHSFANTDQFRVVHADLDLKVDFVKRRLVGSVTLKVERTVGAATEMTLDTRDLEISNVSLHIPEREAENHR